LPNAQVLGGQGETTGLGHRMKGTQPGILEGRSVGMWTVALTCSGNALGLTYDQYKNLSAEELSEARSRITRMFEGSRPHYLIDTIVDLPAVIEDINARLARGEVPQCC
jgi:phosphonoacetaldehyde hydrolase